MKLTRQKVVVKVEREIFMPDYLLKWDVGVNEMSEELEPDEARTWLIERGADPEAVDKAMDYVWNFGNHKDVYVEINEFKSPDELTTDSASPLI